jgi:hypothetical protein
VRTCSWHGGYRAVSKIVPFYPSPSYRHVGIGGERDPLAHRDCRRRRSQAWGSRHPPHHPHRPRTHHSRRRCPSSSSATRVPPDSRASSPHSHGPDHRPHPKPMCTHNGHPQSPRPCVIKKQPVCTPGHRALSASQPRRAQGRSGTAGSRGGKAISRPDFPRVRKPLGLASGLWGSSLCGQPLHPRYRVARTGATPCSLAFLQPTSAFLGALYKYTGTIRMVYRGKAFHPIVPLQHRRELAPLGVRCHSDARPPLSEVGGRRRRCNIACTEAEARHRCWL